MRNARALGDIAHELDELAFIVAITIELEDHVPECLLSMELDLKNVHDGLEYIADHGVGHGIRPIAVGELFVQVHPCSVLGRVKPVSHGQICIVRWRECLAEGRAYPEVDGSARAALGDIEDIVVLEVMVNELMAREVVDALKDRHHCTNEVPWANAAHAKDIGD